jgi:hypothetical protein
VLNNYAERDIGIEQMKIHARRELADAAIDYYVIGSGRLSDDIGKLAGDAAISTTIKSKVSSNGHLTAKVQEYGNDENYQSQDVTSIARFFDRDRFYQRFRVFEHP